VNRAVAPLLAGLLMVDIDALLDPVVAADYACVGAQQNSIGGGFGQAGLGLWNWYYPDPNFDRIPSDLAIWFGVPLFNYAAWWAAPVVLGSLVMVFQSRCAGGGGLACTVAAARGDADGRPGELLPVRSASPCSLCTSW
jgi:hypothetical protein